MRKIHQLRSLESKRTRKRFGLSAAIFGIASAAVVFGTISSGVLSADSAPHATPRAAVTHATVTHAAGTQAADTTAATEVETSSPYSGGHQMTADPSGGYWTVSWLGVVTAHDGAPTFGSPAASDTKLAKPIIDMAATPDGQGYWLVASDGGIFAYGDAQFYGSTGATHLNEPIVGMATTTDGKGYWLVASDGGIFSFGDAAFYGSAGALHLNEPIVGMAPTEDGKGYWLVASDGGIFTYGDAGFIGSLGGTGDPVIGILVNPAAVGYTLVEANGTAVVPTLTPVAAPQVSVPSAGTSSPPKTTSPAPTTPAASTAPTSTTTPSTSSGTLLEGSYDGAADPGNIAAFDAATGTHSEIASDYLPSNSGWTGMDGAGGSLAWLTGPWQGTGYTLSLGVPIIPTNSAGVAQGTLAAGATGAYNSYFVTLAQTLVAAGEGNAYLRLGWEFDGNWYPSWDADTPAAEAQFAAYFDQIVTAMRTVAGEKFQFVWNPDVGAFIESGYNVALAYPGSAYVNDIGLDAYDETWVTPQTPANAWNETTQPGLTAARAFAAAQGKPIAICEWGIAFLSNGHGLGDDPLYINNFAAWMKNPANNVAYESYFNFNGTGNSILTGGTTPNSLAAFKADFG